MKTIRVLYITIKHWLSGEKFAVAHSYATFVVKTGWSFSKTSNEWIKPK